LEDFNTSNILQLPTVGLSNAEAVTRSASVQRRHVEQCAPRDTGGAAVATGAAEEAGESTDRRWGGMGVQTGV